MKFIADLHIHSHFSLATSKNLTPEHLDYWARLKGITVIGTGDFTHPKWLLELRVKLEPAGVGIFKLRKEFRMKLPFENKELEDKDVFFILSAEISNIYKRGGKVRKIHNLLYVPSFEAVESIQNELSKIGNIKSDGRPILGLDSHDLLEIALTCESDTFLVPAHIWTPWFSVLGEKGGFDSIEECFDDLTDYIYAVETGLSTNPTLNWMCSQLDRYALMSNSDAHSPEKLGRNANIFDCDPDYYSMLHALQMNDGKEFIGTIDMFPQEGKYHYDGHRNCSVCWNPVETLQNNGICTVCSKPVITGVVNRIAKLADRTDILERPQRNPFQSIIPLPEILSEITNTGVSSQKLKQLYIETIEKCGSEFDILLNLPINQIKNLSGELLATAIDRMRNGQVTIKEGYDGEFGVVKVFESDEVKQYISGKKNDLNSSKTFHERKLINFDLEEYRKLAEKMPPIVSTFVKQSNERQLSLF